MGFEAEGLWPGASSRCGIDALSQTGSQGADIRIGASLQSVEIPMLEAVPDLGLPATVVVFNGCLKAWFLRWNKDGDDSELEAEPGDSAENIRVVMRPLKKGVVIELSVARKTVCFPVGDEIGEYVVGEQPLMWP